MQEGLIVKGISGFYYVKSNDDIFECKARGIFRKDDKIPFVGDRVQISITDTEKKLGIIESIKDRKNKIIRPPVANIDQIIIVVAYQSPEPDYMLVDKLIIKAKEEDIIPIICVNKIDLCKNSSQVLQCYKNAGYQVFYVSASTRDGIEELKDKMKGKISILAGQSGVGKSTIINSLNMNFHAETGVISSKIERGKHTTRHVQLFEVKDEGYIADTPGFSMVSLEEIEAEEIKSFYPEFDEQQKNCKYSTCNHISEPSCAVKAFVELKKIDADRYNRYKELFITTKSKVRKYK